MALLRGRSHTKRPMKLMLRIRELSKASQVIIGELLPGRLGGRGQRTNNDVPVKPGHVGFRNFTKLTADAIATGRRTDRLGDNETEPREPVTRPILGSGDV